MSVTCAEGCGSREDGGVLSLRHDREVAEEWRSCRRRKSRPSRPALALHTPCTRPPSAAPHNYATNNTAPVGEGSVVNLPSHNRLTLTRGRSAAGTLTAVSVGGAVAVVVVGVPSLQAKWVMKGYKSAHTPQAPQNGAH